MQNIINSIIMLDENAKERLADAKKKSAEILAAAECERQEIIRTNLGKAHSTLSRMDDMERRACDEKLAQIRRDKEERLDTVSRLYEEQAKVWEDEIVSDILSSCGG